MNGRLFTRRFTVAGGGVSISGAGVASMPGATGADLAADFGLGMPADGKGGIGAAGLFPLPGVIGAGTTITGGRGCCELFGPAGTA